MVLKITPEDVYRIRDPKNFHAEIRREVELLRSNRAYLGLTMVIMCCIDALAADSKGAKKWKFENFVKKHFPGLCTALKSVCPPGREGSRILYEEFRNGFVHLRGPNSGYAIAEDHECSGAWADTDVKGKYVAINIDRLAKEFLKLLGT